MAAPVGGATTSSAGAAGESDRPLRVAVVGAGAGGICMGVALRRLGVAEFTIFEQSDGVGGTWYDNTYPGAAVDTPVPFYSFSFHAYKFSRTYCSQAELLRYLEDVVDHFELRPHLRLRTKISSVVWDERTHSYEVTTADGSSRRFDVVVSAVGILNNPKYPDWPGLE
nr:NAD(P)/FAD-dependent oxidoreductase [Micromonospora sp. DSM 115978]